jgi:AcrR family transcriptional regulator
MPAGLKAKIAASAAENPATPKTPRQKRGILKVETLLDAASTVFVEKGFDAATMTEIAERSGASIGSLYQFFPTKDSMADVLRARYGDAICAQWDALTESREGWTGDDLAASLFRITAGTLKSHPYFAVLMVARDRAGVNVVNVRKRYADALTRLLHSRMPHRSKLDLRASMIVVRQIVRCEVDLEIEPPSKERDAARRELEALLAGYLNSRMEPQTGKAKSASKSEKPSKKPVE